MDEWRDARFLFNHAIRAERTWHKDEERREARRLPSPYTIPVG